MSAHVSEPRLLVLHGLRLKGFTEPCPLAALIALAEDAVEDELAALESAGFVLHREGRLTGWALTRDGRSEHERVLAAEVDAVGCRAEVDKGYRRFLDLNRALLEVCTDWQMRDETTLNDHHDAAYDAGVIDRLADIHARVTPIADDLAAHLARHARPRTLEGGSPMSGRFGAVLTAMVTPFDDEGALDLDAAADLARWLQDHGNDGLVVAGTTGESPTLSDAEKLDLWRAVSEAVTIPAIAGTGSNDTAHSVSMTSQAAPVGAAGVLVV